MGEVKREGDEGGGKGKTEGIRRGRKEGKEKRSFQAREGWGGARKFIGGWGVGGRRADLF